jgi:hypothetical protein
MWWNSSVMINPEVLIREGILASFALFCSCAEVPEESIASGREEEGCANSAVRFSLSLRARRTARSKKKGKPAVGAEECLHFDRSQPSGNH